jgi:outer membrane protein OmpA-like peptidoglycan-associated protein
MKYLIVLLLSLLGSFGNYNHCNESNALVNNCDDAYISREIYFKMGSANIDFDKSSKELERIANHIIFCNKKFQISVHNDSRGPEKSSVDITILKANNIKESLVNLGVNQDLLFPVGKGCSEPIINNPQSESEYALNRRVEITPL